MRVYSNVTYRPVEIDKVRELIYCGLSANQIARETGSSAPSIYSAVQRFGDIDLENYLRANGRKRQSKPFRTKTSPR